MPAIRTLRLRPDVFDDVLACRRAKNDLTTNDLAVPGEPASLYLLSFFSLSRDVAVPLFSRLFAHLVAYGEISQKIGLVTSYDEAYTLAKQLGLAEKENACRQKYGVRSLASDLGRFFRSPFAVGLLFPKEACR